MVKSIIHALNGVTATTTSAPINVEGAKKVTLQFIRTNHASGKTVFTVTASLDGTTFSAFAGLISAGTAVAASETIARVASYDTGTANASAIYSLDLTVHAFKEIKVVATETTDGTHDAWVYIEY